MAISAVRTVIIYLVLVAAMRIMGKRQLGDLQPIELVVTLLVADTAAVAIENSSTSLLSGLIPILILVSLELLFSGLILKFPAVARLTGGHPVILIDNGKLDQAALKKLRLSIEDVLSALRQQGVFDLDTVQYAIAETGGAISVCLKPQNQPLTPCDAEIEVSDNGTPFLVVSDGEISKWGLSMTGHDEAWLRKTIKKAGCALPQVFLLTADKSGRTYLIKKEKSR